MRVLREILDPRRQQGRFDAILYDFWERINREWLYVTFELFSISEDPNDLQELLHMCPHQWMHILVDQNKLSREDYESIGFEVLSWLDDQMVLRAPSNEQNILSISELISRPDDGECWSFFLSNSKTCEFKGGYRFDMDSYDLLIENVNLFQHHIRFNLDRKSLELFTRDSAIFDKVIAWSKPSR